VWLVIVVCHLRYRRQRGRQHLAFRMPGHPVSNWLAIVFLLAIVAIQLRDASSRIAALIAISMLAALGVAYAARRPSAPRA
jgi:AAT family amino acid transporter